MASFRIKRSDTGSKVLVHTNLTLSGSVAQYGRGAGMIQEMSAQLIKQFATNLCRVIDAEAVAAPLVAAPPLRPMTRAKPTSGISLMLKVQWSSLRRLFVSRQSAG